MIWSSFLFTGTVFIKYWALLNNFELSMLISDVDIVPQTVLDSIDGRAPFTALAMIPNTMHDFGSFTCCISSMLGNLRSFELEISDLRHSNYMAWYSQTCFNVDWKLLFRRCFYAVYQFSFNVISSYMIVLQFIWHVAVYTLERDKK